MKDALIALGMGGPESVETIRPFLYNLFSDREIINFHIGNYPQKLLAKIIASKRSEKLAAEYIKMGFGGASPQNVHTKKLLAKLPALYEAKTGRRLEAFPGMCYFHPFIEEAAEKVAGGKYERIIIMSLFPQYSYTTTGACFAKMEKFTNLLYQRTSDVSIVPYWYKDEAYCSCIVKRINEAAARMDKNPEECSVLFSAHSLPERMICEGDLYVEQIKDHASLIGRMAGLSRWMISYQSKVGPVKWVGPSTVSVLEEIKKNKTDNIIVVPIAFISDHIETLIELDEQLIPVIRRAGLKIERAASLNSDDDFAEALAGIIAKRDK